MKSTKKQIRLARKRGWNDSQTRELVSHPYDNNIDLNLEYEDAFFEGKNADKEAINPYGFYT